MNNIHVLGLILLILSSCNKESENKPQSLPPNDSIYISKIIELDDNFAAPLDSVYKIECKYDNQHRIINFIEIYYLNSPITTDTPKIVTLYYNGSDSIPYKATMLKNNSTPSETFETHFYTFSNSNPRQLIYDSIRYTALATGNTGLKVITCNYYADSTVVFERYQNQKMKYNIIKVNGNITFQDDGLVTSNQTYDANPNPLFKLKFLLNEFYRIGAEYNENYYLEFEKNNLTEINNENSLLHTKFRYYYIYNSNGHPLEVSIQNLLSSPQRPNKIKYFYTK